MDDFSGSAMIALLPTNSEWCKQDCPHLTLVYAGEIKELNPGTFNEMAKDASSLAMLSSPISLRVVGVDIFGDEPEERVNVLKLQPSSELLAMRRPVEDWNASQHPFTPHVTVGPAHMGIDVIPDSIYFDRIMVSFGEHDVTFWLRR